MNLVKLMILFASMYAVAILLFTVAAAWKDRGTPEKRMFFAIGTTVILSFVAVVVWLNLRILSS